MKNRSTQMALLLMLAISVFASCSHTKNKNGNPEPIIPTITCQDNEAEVLEQEECDSTNINIAIIDIPGDVKVNIHHGKSMLLKMDGVSLSAPDTAIIRKGTYTVTALTTEELPPLADEMVNVTFGSGDGYRFLPNGEHFSPYAELRMSYDESKLPHGYTPDDIYTSYYDEEKKTWVRLFRKEIDTVNKEIVSLTTHFTDFVNEILKVPEMPETQAFVPTMMTDLEAANPLEGITMIQPPTANNMGTANLSYPLQIPAGRQGMQPNLALTYNSNGGNGWLGIGWDISIPCISVETRWGVPLYSSVYETETYLLNGEQLLVNYDSLPAFARKYENRFSDGKRFYSRIEGSFDSIVRHGDNPKNYWWEVVDRSGTHYYYGNSERNTKVYELKTGEGNIGKWYLSKVVDKNGNSIHYSYKYYDNNDLDGKLSGRALYPDTILYALPSRIDTLTHWYGHSITFSYRTNRFDPIISGNLGVKENYCFLLDEIKTNYVKYEPHFVIDTLPFDTAWAIFNLFPTDYPINTKFDNFVCINDIYEKWYSMPVEERYPDEEWINMILKCLYNTKYWENNHINLWHEISKDYIDTSFLMYKQEDKMIRGYKLLYDTSLYTKKSRLAAVVEMSPSEWENKLSLLSLNTLDDTTTNTLKYHKFKYHEYSDLRDEIFSYEYWIYANNMYYDNSFIFNVFDISPLGSNKSTNYNINAGIGAGLGKETWKQTFNLNANGNIGISSKNEGESTLVDINGDGYPDIVYKDFINEELCLFTKLYNPINQQYNEEKFRHRIIISGDNFQISKTKKSYSIGVDLNAGGEVSGASVGANLGYQYSSSKSLNTVYYTDADANGLVDILVNGIVYFNMGISGDSIIFTHTPPKVTEQLSSCSNNYYTLEESENINPDLFREGNMTITKVYEKRGDVVGEVNSNELIFTQDTSYLQPNDPDTIRRNVVRVWVAPKAGYITISGVASLDPTFDKARRVSDNDGVRLSIQHNGVVKDSAYLDTITTLRDMTIPNAFEVEKGDRIYFRVESLKDNYYDIVNWSPIVTYNSTNTIAQDYEGRKIYEYNSEEDFFAWKTENFNAPIDECVYVNSKYIVKDPFSSTIYLSANIVDTGNIIVDTIFNDVISPGTVVWGGTEEEFSLGEGQRIVFEARSDYEVDWTKLSWNPIIRSSCISEGQPNISVLPNTNDTIYSIDQTPSPIYRTFVTHTLTEEVTPTTYDNIKFVTSDSALFGRNIKLVKRTSAGADFLDSANISSDITSFSLYNQTAGFYEIYVPGIMPEDISSTYAYILSSQKEIGIKFDSIFDLTDTNFNIPNMRAFGNINHQWGQFAYNTDELRTPINEQKLRLNELDPNQANMLNNFSDSTISLDSIDMFVSSVPNQDETMVGQMTSTLDTSIMQHIWTGFAYRTFITPTHMSASNWQMKKTMVIDSSVYETVSNTHLNNICSPKVGPIRESSQTAHNYSASVSLSIPLRTSWNGSLNYSHGKTRQLQDYMDMNGDGYPDIVVENGVQYTNSRGGFSSYIAGNAPENIQGIHISEYNSFSTQGGASFAEYTKYIDQKGSVKIAQSSYDGSSTDENIYDISESPNFDPGANGCLSWSKDSIEVSFTDINGDGLPDKIYGGKVFLNLGYAYYQGTILTDNPLNENSSFNYVLGSTISKSFDIPNTSNSASSTVNRSFSAGMGLSYSNNNSKTIYSDVNGDGLADKIEEGNKICFNTGWGFSDTCLTIDPETSTIESGNRTLNFDINGRFTAGVPVFMFKIQGSGGLNKSNAYNNTESMFMDMNADGLPDIVTRDGGNIIIKYNNLYKVDKLKSVTSFYGNKISLEYEQAKHSDYARQRPTVLSSFTIEDTVIGDVNSGVVMECYIEYKNYYHHTGERTPYGFDTVITTTFNGFNDSRRTLEIYHNNNYKLRGIKHYEGTFDTHGNCHLDKQWFYKMKEITTGNIVDDGKAHCYGPTFPALDSSVVRYYDISSGVAKLTTAEKFGHGSYGRNDTVIIHNDISTSKDDIKVLLLYHPNVGNNQSALVESHEVRSSNALLRKKLASYDNRGNIKSISVYDGSSYHTIDYDYDKYGNIIKVQHPANDNNGSRLTYSYAYDTFLFKHVVQVSDNTFGTTSRADYNLEIGKPMTTYSVSGDSISYNYDDWGRLLAIRVPNEADTLQRPTVLYVRWDNAPEAIASNNPNFRGFTGSPKQRLSNRHIKSIVIPQQNVQRLWVQTHHHSALDTLQKIVTYIFTDGMGRVAQTRKTAEINGIRKQISSGRVEYDAWGRTIKTYDSFVIGDNINGYVVPLSVGMYTTTTYDILDRKLSDAVHHDNQTDITQYTYDFATKNGFSTIKNTITDAKGNSNVIYNDSRELKQVVVDGNGNTTLFGYDALGQLIESTDPEGFITYYSYDMRGLLLKRIHPDAGTNTYKYDALGQVTKETNNAGEEIIYKYDHNRLIEKKYGSIQHNSVYYTYGATTDLNKTSIGRITRIRDGSGYQELYYDKMGNVSKNIRTFALPYNTVSYTFEMNFKYDSWGKVIEMEYPDGEQVYYGYNAAGELKSVKGEKMGLTHSYIDSIYYNDYGGKAGVWYGNGTVSFYGYDELHRMINLQSFAKVNNSLVSMQDIKYTYDKVSNITDVANSAGTVLTLGNMSSASYNYDAANRLLSAKLIYGNNLVRYNLEYTPSGRMIRKNYDVPPYYYPKDIVYGYCDKIRQHAPRRIVDVSSDQRSIYDLQWDLKGNLATNTCYNFGDPQTPRAERYLYWTEDNRLHTVVDDRYYSYYTYDHTGERTLKLTGDNSFVDVNGYTQSTATLDNATLYVGPYLVVTNHGYTKHYYNGTERICAKLGNGGFSSKLVSNDGYFKIADALFDECQNSMANQRIENENDPLCPQIISGEWAEEARLNGINVTESQLSATTNINLFIFDNTLSSLSTKPTAIENLVYFYHSDHLGSASWITNGSGTPVQHLQYMPYGEPFVNERISSYNERFTFTGKERDSETGFSYFGARYYDSDLMTGWLSVDPMADKYPGLSPYAYCGWNPVKLVDPDGREIRIYYKNKSGIAKLFERRKYIVYTPNMNYLGNNSFVKETVNALNYVIKGDTQGIINTISNDQENVVKIKKTYIGNDHYSPKSNTIKYHPQSGLLITDENGNSIEKGQSPALGLLHELGHSYIDLYMTKEDKQEMSSFDNQYDLKEERWVIENIETPAAKILGEGVRYNHDGYIYRTNNSTSTDEI
ncbi:MAG: hypothetical protein IKY79_08390 [Bacteroidales bacterium]|nr:hypothetical protein [Bacteroidales bacterium]